MRGYWSAVTGPGELTAALNAAALLMQVGLTAFLKRTGRDVPDTGR